ncbi:MAG: hypothetical protein M3323_05690 [Actinomycetota bacterium]|nr:hypothetical protein [Actinomycetota bacterium]
MEPGDGSFYRPAVLWGVAAGIGAFLAEYVANDGSAGRALLWAALGAVTVGLFFGRLLGMKEGRQRRPQYYAREARPSSEGAETEDKRQREQDTRGQPGSRGR